MKENQKILGELQVVSAARDKRSNEKIDGITKAAVVEHTRQVEFPIKTLSQLISLNSRLARGTEKFKSEQVM